MGRSSELWMIEVARAEYAFIDGKIDADTFAGKLKALGFDDDEIEDQILYVLGG